MNRRRGGALLEAALFLPMILALLIGTVELGRVVYTYYMLQKAMLNLARYLGTQQGVNFCNSQDPTVQSSIDYALTGNSDSSQNPIVLGLTPAMIQVRAEQYNPTTGQLTVCDCSATGCDASQGGLPPDFIVVSLNGYMVQPLFWGFAVNPFQLSPGVRVPYGGT
jgi:Flp pilus assembly protein TadG